MKNRILVTGSNGLLAPYLIREAIKYGDVITTSRASGDIHCDLTDKTQVSELVAKARPQWVIHAAAMTNVDQCELDPTTAYAINAQAVKNIVEAIDSDKRLVHLSTDQVYPNVSGLHVEENVNPVNVYGKSKLDGETFAIAHCNCAVYRINLFGHSLTSGRQSLDDFVVSSLQASYPITLFADVLFSPLHMSTIAEIILLGLQKDISGIFNLGCRNGFSKAEFGLAVAQQLNLDSNCATIGNSLSIPARATRPNDLRMNVEKIEAKIGIKMPTLIQEITKL